MSPSQQKLPSSPKPGPYRLTRDPTEDERKGHPWAVTILRALNPDGSLLWDHQDISQYRNTWQGGGDAIFLATWMQKADAMAGDIFSPDRFQYYCHNNYQEEVPSATRPGRMVRKTAKDLLAEGVIQEILPDTRLLVSLQASDLALKKANVMRVDRDYYARANAWASRDGKLFIEEVFQNRLTETEMIEDLVSHGRRSKAQAIGIESVSFQFLIYEKAAKTAHLPIVELDPEGRDKVLRARGLAARYNVRPLGQVFHRYDMANLRPFEAQMTAFPNGAHDDMVDAVVYLHELAVKYAGGSYANLSRDISEMRKKAQTMEKMAAGNLPQFQRPRG